MTTEQMIYELNEIVGFQNDLADTIAAKLREQELRLQAQDQEIEDLKFERFKCQLKD